MPGTWDGAGRKPDALSLAYAQLGAVPQARARLPCSLGLRASEGARVRARSRWLEGGLQFWPRELKASRSSGSSLFIGHEGQSPALNCSSCLASGMGEKGDPEAPGQAGTSGYSLLSVTRGFTRNTPSWAQDIASTPSRRHSCPRTSPREPPVGEKGKNSLLSPLAQPSGLLKGAVQAGLPHTRAHCVLCPFNVFSRHGVPMGTPQNSLNALYMFLGFLNNHRGGVRRTVSVSSLAKQIYRTSGHLC